MTEERERRKVQLESLLSTPLGKERLAETYRTKFHSADRSGVMAAKPTAGKPLREMIEAILCDEFQSDQW